MTRPGRAGPEHVEPILERVLEASNVAEQIRRQVVLQAWAGLVGEQIAAVTHARSLSEGTLFVAVRSSAWLMELELIRGEILRRVHAGLGQTSPERIVFVLGTTER